MKALIFDQQPDGQAGLRLARDFPPPIPLPGQARIRLTLAGICNTDLEVVRGYAAFSGVLGHEFVGVVEQAENPGLVGLRVVGEISASCGECESCLKGRPTHCPHRTTLGIRDRSGVFSEFFCLPVSNLHPVPGNLADREAVFAEPLAAACQILTQLHVRPTDRVIVVGDGKLGLLIAQVLALTGCELMVAGRHEEKLEILASRGIPTHMGDEGLARGADLVVECTGQAQGFQAARQLVRPRGTLVLKSTYHGLVQTDLSSLVVDEVKVVGSRCGPFPAALRLLSRGLVEVAPLIEAEYPLADGLAAFEHAGQRGALKVLLRP